jgi:hypothetical protein
VSEPPKRNLRTLWLILAVCAAPVVLSFAFYFLMPRATSSNYGELLPTQAAPPLTGTRADGKPWSIEDERGAWVVVFARRPRATSVARRACTRRARRARCRDASASAWRASGSRPATRPRTARGSPSTRTSSSCAPTRARVERLPRGADAIYLVDPLGNQVLAWPARPTSAASRATSRSSSRPRGSAEVKSRSTLAP